MINFYKRKIQDKTLTKLNKFETNCWINVLKPDEKELDYLANNFELDIEMLENGLDKYELPGIFFEENATYIYIKTNNTNNELTTILIILKHNFILTLSNEKTNLIKELFKDKTNFITTQRQKSTIKILTINTDYFEDYIMHIVKKVNSKKKTTQNLREKDINLLLEYEEILNNYSSVYVYTQRLYNKMIKKISFFTSDTDDLEDMINESEQGLNICNKSLKTISNIRYYYSLQLSNKLNKSITILTIFTILISISTALSGLYGMNVKLPLATNPFAFYYILILIVILMAGFIYYLKSKKVFF